MNQVTVLNDESRLVTLLSSRVDTDYLFIGPTQVYEDHKDVSP